MHRISLEYTVADLKRHEDLNPQEPQWVNRHLARTYEQFITVLYKELNRLISDLESDGNRLQNDSEDRLNSDICRNLRSAGYSATHDENMRGHVDITVRFADYVWIAEGKKVAGVNNSYLAKGYRQLATRYLKGKPNANEAALLVYVFGADAAKVIKTWNGKFKQKAQRFSKDEITLVPDDLMPDHAFYSSATHGGSGTSFRVRHVGVMIHWDPHDDD
jgi:hypothetical protein